MPDPASNIHCCGGVEGSFEFGLQGFDAARGLGIEPLFYLRPGVLDRGELRQVAEGRYSSPIPPPQSGLLLASREAGGGSPSLE